MNKVLPLPSKILLEGRLYYNTSSGVLYWKRVTESYASINGWSNKRRKQHNTCYSDKAAGHEFTTSSGDMSMQVRIDGKSYYVHRIIWKLVTGEDCKVIDHIDGNPLNNLFNNLRDVDNLTNSKNCKLSSSNKSGHTGVTWSKATNKWEAYIWKDSKKYHLGRFVNKVDAIIARKKKELEFGYHENHGKIR